MNLFTYILVIGAPHVILKIYNVHPYTYLLGVDFIYFKNYIGYAQLNWVKRTNVTFACTV